MFNRFYGLCIRIFSIVALVAGIMPVLSSAAEAAPQGKHKNALADAQENPFDHTKQVSDEELSKMRGGFIDINGVLIDFNFLSRVQVGLDMLSNVSVDTGNLAQAASTATQIQDFLQPQIIQNMDSNTLISIQQALNLNIVNAQQFSNLAQLQQSAYQQSLGFQ